MLRLEESGLSHRKKLYSFCIEVHPNNYTQEYITHPMKLLVIDVSSALQLFTAYKNVFIVIIIFVQIVLIFVKSVMRNFARTVHFQTIMNQMEYVIHVANFQLFWEI